MTRPLDEREIARIMRDARATYPDDITDDGSVGEAVFAVAILSLIPWAALLWIFLS